MEEKNSLNTGSPQKLSPVLGKQPLAKKKKNKSAKESVDTPWYKKWWVIVLILGGLFIILIGVIALFVGVFYFLNQTSTALTQGNLSITTNIHTYRDAQSHDCTHLDVATASEQTVSSCNAYNYCDKIEPHDIVVREFAKNAITAHLGEEYSTAQILDVYAWTKQNVAYQNVPLDDFAPYRPSETIALKTGDCKNYGVLISSMISSMGGLARVAVPSTCPHAFAEVWISQPKTYKNVSLSSLLDDLRQRYPLIANMSLDIINDSQGYWLILDGAGADYPGTTSIDHCLDKNAEMYYSYSCISPDGKIDKQTYKKEQISKTFTWSCATCDSINDCAPECKSVCKTNDWAGVKTASGVITKKYLGKNYIDCSCSCYK